MGRHVDFAIVTVLDVERDAVLRRLDAARRVALPDDPYVYYRGMVGIPGTESSYDVVVAQLLDVGNIESSAATTELIHRWNPRHILLVGIAGGVASQGVVEGDVIVADFVYYYEPGKRIPNGEQRRPKQYRCDRVLRSWARHVDASSWIGTVTALLPEGVQGRVPRVRFGPIACGEWVIADGVTIPQLLAECPQMLAVAMEAAGVAQAAENSGRGFLEIRGVSDLADRTKSDAWHAFAADSAAAFVRGLLESKPVAPQAIDDLHETSPSSAPSARLFRDRDAQDLFRCPNCSRADRTEKASSIVAAETERVDRDNGTSIRRSGLASMLRPPPKPPLVLLADGSLAPALLGLVLLIVSLTTLPTLLVSWASLSPRSWTLADPSILHDVPLVMAGWTGIIVLSLLLRKVPAVCRQQDERTRMLSTHRDLVYCRRCDGLFLPGTDAPLVEPSRMEKFLQRRAREDAERGYEALEAHHPVSPG